MHLDTVKILNNALNRFKKIWLTASIAFVVAWVINTTALSVLIVFFLIIGAVVFINQLYWFIISAIPLGLILIFALMIIFNWTNLAYLKTVISEEKNKNILASLSSTLPLAKDFTFFSIKRGVFIIGLFGFFIIPGIIWSIWDALSEYVFLLDKNFRGGLKPLYKSRSLMRGYFWKIAGMLILFQIAANAVGVIFIGSDEGFYLWILAGVINLISIFAITPFFLIVFHEIYKFLQYPNAEHQPSVPIISIILSTLGWIIIFTIISIIYITTNNAFGIQEKNFTPINNIEINQFF